MQNKANNVLFLCALPPLALTAPGFGAATTTTAAPATGFSFGSTNTGKTLIVQTFLLRHLKTVFTINEPVLNLALCHLIPCHSLFLAACLLWLQDLGGWELETPRLVGLVLGGSV